MVETVLVQSVLEVADLVGVGRVEAALEVVAQGDRVAVALVTAGQVETSAGEAVHTTGAFLNTG